MGEVKCVILKSTTSDFNYEFDCESKVIPSDKLMRKVCREEGKVEERDFPDYGGSVGVKVYSYDNEQGSHLLYVNNSDYNFIEKLTFTLNNLEIKGEKEKTTLELYIQSGQEEFVKMVRINP